MSFLDSLEDNLKNLERQDFGARHNRDRQQMDSERAKAMAAAAHAEQLRKDPYTAELLKQVTRLSHAIRTKVNLAWIGTTLRLEARGRRLELRPTSTGVVAAFIEGNREVRTAPLDLGSNPEDLAREWLAAMPAREEPPAEAAFD